MKAITVSEPNREHKTLGDMKEQEIAENLGDYWVRLNGLYWLQVGATFALVYKIDNLPALRVRMCPPGTTFTLTSPPKIMN